MRIIKETKNGNTSKKGVLKTFYQTLPGQTGTLT
jgi:hypothetical protein